MNLLERLDNKWKAYPENAWGDRLDVRYYLASRLSKLEHKRVLDVGCNVGVLLSEASGSNDKYGVDIDKKAVAEASKHDPSAKIVGASMYSLPFEGGFFDAVVCANVLPGADFYVPPRERAKLQAKMVSEATRVLKKGGRLYFTTPNNARYKTDKADCGEVCALLSPFFYFQIRGWNPFPRFPFFLPARMLRLVPGWFSFLAFLCEHRFFAKTSKFFYVEAVKK